MENAVALFGSFDENIKEIEKAYGVGILCRGTQIKISGDPEKVSLAGKAVQSLLSLISRGEELNDQDIHYVMDLVNEGNEDQVNKISSDVICITSKGRPVKAKTLGQKAYIEAIKNTTVTIGVGPAGTGKTYLAVAMAVKAFRNQEVNRIILTRPAVEAGEKLGFLPGDLQSKIDPYLRPLYDALYEIIKDSRFEKPNATPTGIAPRSSITGTIESKNRKSQRFNGVTLLS